jgi:hypothetical protein
MLIKFNILWVEDDQRYINTAGGVLRTYLENLGFHLEIDQIINPQETPVEDYLNNTSKYDLILVDWRFNNVPGEPARPMGGSIIERIRSRVTYADIIFYSGAPEFEEDFQNRNLQGVYLSGRKELKEEAKDLIEHLLHKTLHPKIMRGIVVSELSQIDDLCYRIIEKKYNDPSCDKLAFASSIRSSIKDQADSQHGGKMRFIDKGDDDFIAGLHSTIYLDSHKRTLKVSEFASADGLTANILEHIQALPDTVLKRNKLAHWKRAEETDTYIKLTDTGKSDYIFDQAEAALVRKSINNAAYALQQYLDSMQTDK